MMPRILLLLATTTYKAPDFIAAASELGVDVIVGSNQKQALADLVPDSTLEVDFNDLRAGTSKIVELAERRPLDAIVAAEDDGALLAAASSARLGLPHNSPQAVAAAHYKHRMREVLETAPVRSPAFKIFSVNDDPRTAATTVEYPCVLKPVLLSASRGVIRADDEDGFVTAFQRVARILASPDVVERHDEAASLIMAEDFVPGDEVALEGVITDGELHVLALFDKPEPLDGPFFEETYYITPSRKPQEVRRAIEECVAATSKALGLRHGPVHAELRANDAGVWMIEIAPRTIGGLCARTLRFGAGISLEQLVLRHAAGLDLGDMKREADAAGVLMLPIPRAGKLKGVEALDEAKTVTGIEEVTISIPVGQEVVPLPEGHRYLGFIFARAATPEAVESALREAQRLLRIIIDRTDD